MFLPNMEILLFFVSVDLANCLLPSFKLRFFDFIMTTNQARGRPQKKSPFHQVFGFTFTQGEDIIGGTA
jgi:hypothetical protein